MTTGSDPLVDVSRDRRLRRADINPERGETTNGEQNHHQLRDHRLDPYADHVGCAADHARPDRHAGDRCRQGRRRDPAPARARSEGRPAVAGPERLHAVSAAHQASDRRGGQHHHRRRRHHDGRAAHFRGADAFAGNVLAQHGLDELRALSDGAALQELEIRLGGELSHQFRRLHLPQHVSRHRKDLQDCSAKATASNSSTNATTPATSTISPIASIAACSSRRSSCS